MDLGINLAAFAAAAAAATFGVAWWRDSAARGGASRSALDEAAFGSGRSALGEEASCRALGLPTPAEASALPVVRLPSFLSAEEIATLRLEVKHAQIEKQVGMMERGRNELAATMGVWRTSYMHTNGTFARRLPALRTKLRDAMLAVDAAHWGLLAAGGHDAAHVRFRTVEVHEYGAGGRLASPQHYDAGSLLTIDVMLAEPGVDFEGGMFVAPRPEADRTATPSVDRFPEFGRGDAVVFPSHKYHNVEPVTRGRRMVLVAELWVGPEKECAHRCLTAADECGYSLERNHLATYVQQLAMLG